jgi:hypothetical protein
VLDGPVFRDRFSLIQLTNHNEFLYKGATFGHAFTKFSFRP